ncbi:hypothetical protein ATE68_08705 [Sphingopyxis sp. H038]|nr:hypothetical protein ATE78_05115 [Sphingopyxis sp. H012]KTE09217.1 hypothetical protein ATE70_15305 [Sphingopyxis sp. H053]KTE35089.1 hypothetical protein ATE68_08705 [Sphingopyxis sp. H038]KTE43948.1 hypothetical protein ATE77_10520 [Sphingopyxis sp. H005]KTE47911.1 hypothetical protein ATE73_06155 [Sphingopyxis sp. H077]KTE69236.1 hypothetical protein ATE74_08410 [Sphingopyxis sp. H085]
MRDRSGALSTGLSSASHFAAVLVAQAPHGNAKINHLFNQLGCDDFAQIARTSLLALGQFGIQDLGGSLVSQPLHIGGDMFEPIIMGANSFDQAVANLVATICLLDERPVRPPSVCVDRPVAPFLKKCHKAPRDYLCTQCQPPCRATVVELQKRVSGKLLCHRNIATSA